MDEGHSMWFLLIADVRAQLDAARLSSRTVSLSQLKGLEDGINASLTQQLVESQKTSVKALSETAKGFVAAAGSLLRAELDRHEAETAAFVDGLTDEGGERVKALLAAVISKMKEGEQRRMGDAQQKLERARSAATMQTSGFAARVLASTAVQQAEHEQALLAVAEERDAALMRCDSAEMIVHGIKEAEAAQRELLRSETENLKRQIANQEERYVREHKRVVELQQRMDDLKVQWWRHGSTPTPPGKSYEWLRRHAPPETIDVKALVEARKRAAESEAVLAKARQMKLERVAREEAEAEAARAEAARNATEAQTQTSPQKRGSSPTKVPTAAGPLEAGARSELLEISGRSMSPSPSLDGSAGGESESGRVAQTSPTGLPLSSDSAAPAGAAAAQFSAVDSQASTARAISELLEISGRPENVELEHEAASPAKVRSKGFHLQPISVDVSVSAAPAERPKPTPAAPQISGMREVPLPQLDSAVPAQHTRAPGAHKDADAGRRQPLCSPKRSPLRSVDGTPKRLPAVSASARRGGREEFVTQIVPLASASPQMLRQVRSVRSAGDIGLGASPSSSSGLRTRAGVSRSLLTSPSLSQLGRGGGGVNSPRLFQIHDFPENAFGEVPRNPNRSPSKRPGTSDAVLVFEQSGGRRAIPGPRSPASRGGSRAGQRGAARSSARPSTAASVTVNLTLPFG